MNSQDKMYEYKYLKYFTKYIELKKTLEGGANFKNQDVNTFTPENIDQLLNYLYYINNDQKVTEGQLRNILVRFYQFSNIKSDVSKAIKAKDFIIGYEPNKYPNMTPIEVLLLWWKEPNDFNTYNMKNLKAYIKIKNDTLGKDSLLQLLNKHISLIPKESIKLTEAKNFIASKNTFEKTPGRVLLEWFREQNEKSKKI